MILKKIDKGHFGEDTPENRKQLEDTANSTENYLGQDKRGNDWYAKILENGKQLWAEVRSGTIRDGGINNSVHQFNENTGLKRDSPPKQNAKKTIRNIGDVQEMRLTGNQIFESIIKYIEKYNSEINYKEDVIDAINEIKSKKNDIVNNTYSELEGYKLMISLLDIYYNRTNSDNIGAFLGEIDLIQDNISMDPAAWDDWIEILNTTIKTSNTSNSGDTSTIPLATGVIGAIGSILSKKRKK